MILFLTEYFKKSGLGHLRRCIAFSELFVNKGFLVQTVVNTDDPKAELFNSHYVIQNWLEDINLNSEYQVIIVDSYRAETNVYEKLMKFTKHLVVIDDDNRIDYPAGCIIYNGGLGGFIHQYDSIKYKKILIGPEFALLRKPFRDVSEYKIIKDNVTRILITMGGSDPVNLTSKLIPFYVTEFPNIHLDIIVGPGFTGFDETKISNLASVEFHRNLEASAMCNLMNESDLCVTAGGQTIYELGRLGVPFIVIKTAENQNGNIKGLIHAGVIEYYIDPFDEDFMQKLQNSNRELENKTNRLVMSQKLTNLFNKKSFDIVGSILN